MIKLRQLDGIVQRECEELYLSGAELTVFPDKEKAPGLRDSPGADGE